METLIVSALFLILIVVGLFAASKQQEKLADPENTEVVYLDQIASVAQLTGSGTFRLRTYRQSGNLQKDDVVFKSATDAIKAGVSSFKRSKIPYVVIRANTSSMLSFSRPYHCHRGSQEGKKMGAIEIVRV
jgi:hypothetical protein